MVLSPPRARFWCHLHGRFGSRNRLSHCDASVVHHCRIWLDNSNRRIRLARFLGRSQSSHPTKTQTSQIPHWQGRRSLRAKRYPLSASGNGHFLLRFGFIRSDYVSYKLRPCTRDRSQFGILHHCDIECRKLYRSSGAGDSGR